MEKEYFLPSRKEFIIIALLLLVINIIAIVPENVFMVKWSRFISTFLFLGYLLVKHKIYTRSSFLIGFICIVLTDFCLIYFDYFVVSLLFMLLGTVGFGFFLWNITKAIEWNKVTFSNILILVLLLCFKFYLVVFILELIEENVDPVLHVLFYIYASISILFTFIAGLAYLQEEKAGNEHYVITPYAYLISNTFLGLAMYSTNYWSYYLSRTFYIITLCVLAHYIVVRLYDDNYNAVINQEAENEN